ncbi:hypothetical protein OE88DRAFT_1632880, partial [Heliocybe sulcata]
FENGQWFVPSVSRHQAVDNVLVPIYSRLDQEGKPIYNRSNPDTSMPHKLSLLYIVLAIGALMDFTLPHANSEVTRYFHLARVALSLQSIYQSPLLETIQTMALMGGYLHMEGGQACIHSAWAYTTPSIKLAQSVGVFLDCSQWGLDARTVRERGYTFWALMSSDAFLSMHLGHPLTCPVSCIDCEFPAYDGEEDETLCCECRCELRRRLWQFRTVRDWLLPACENMLAVPAPNYQSILALDSKMVQEQVPTDFRFLTDPEQLERPSGLARASIMSLLQLNTMMYIHRNFFAQAILDHPSNPFQSPHAHSYLTAYCCASTQIPASMQFYHKQPELFQQLTPFWSHVFSAILITGFVVARTPTIWMADMAVVEFGHALEFFESVARASNSYRVNKCLSVLRKLKGNVYNAYQKRHPIPTSLSDRETPQTIDTEGRTKDFDELALFGGRTFSIPTSQLSISAPRTSAAGASTRIEDASMPPALFDAVHPVLTEPTQLDMCSIFTEIPPLPANASLPELQSQVADYQWLWTPTSATAGSELPSSDVNPGVQATHPGAYADLSSLSGNADIDSWFTNNRQSLDHPVDEVAVDGQ